MNLEVYCPGVGLVQKSHLKSVIWTSSQHLSLSLYFSCFSVQKWECGFSWPNLLWSSTRAWPMKYSLYRVTIFGLRFFGLIKTIFCCLSHHNTICNTFSIFLPCTPDALCPHPRCQVNFDFDLNFFVTSSRTIHHFWGIGTHTQGVYEKAHIVELSFGNGVI